MNRTHPFDLESVKLLDGFAKDYQELNRKYLLSMDIDRLLHAFRLTAGLPSDAKPLGGWESPEIELRGHFAGHYLSACALMAKSTGDAELVKKASSLISGLAECQDRNGDGYVSAFPTEFFDRVEACKHVWAPYYTIHKILAGLYDMHVLCGSAKALVVLERLLGWIKGRLDKLTEEQAERMLLMEYGGMEELLWNMYGLTGNAVYMKMARRFEQRKFIAPLEKYRDELKGWHANTQIPKIIGAARAYELTRDLRYRNIVDFFWKQVSDVRAYASGGTSNYEYWREEPYQLSTQLGANDHECCCTYNMLKLTRMMFAWEQRPQYFDYYERALFNGIFGTQHHKTGGAFMYYVPMRPGLYRVFCEPESSFVCCSGTGIESFSKLADSIYFQDNGSLYVNLFISSELDWREKGVKIVQKTRFPESDTTRLSISCKRNTEFTLKIRIPYWTDDSVSIRINGEKIDFTSSPSSYFEIRRKWRDGDKIEAKLPMKFHLHRMPDRPSRAAVMYGPLVLAGAMGSREMDENMKRGFGGNVYRCEQMCSCKVPEIVTSLPVERWMKPDGKSPLVFRTTGVGKPSDVKMIPFHQITGQRYSLYWEVIGENELQRREEHRKRYKESAFDSVIVGDELSDWDHNFQAYRFKTGELNGRKFMQSPMWFKYDMDLPKDGDVFLRCSYVRDEDNMMCSIYVGGELITEEGLKSEKSGKLVTVEYRIPRETAGRYSRAAVYFKVPANKPKPLESTIGDTTVEKKFEWVTPKVFECAILRR